MEESYEMITEILVKEVNSDKYVMVADGIPAKDAEDVGQQIWRSSAMVVHLILHLWWLVNWELPQHTGNSETK